MSSNRLRSASGADFLPKDGEDFFPSAVDDWALQKKLVLYRIEENADRIEEVDVDVRGRLEKLDAAQKDRVDQLELRVRSVESKLQYHLGKVAGVAIGVSFLLTFLIDYLNLFSS